MTPQTPQQTVDLLAASVGVPAPRLPEDPKPQLLDLPDGLHKDVPAGLYHQKLVGIASNSALKEMAKSPAHYLAWATGDAEAEEKDAFTFGRGFHCAMLEPDVYARTYAVEPDFGDCRKTANKTRRDEWRVANAGRELISGADDTTIRRMVESVRRHPIADQMLRDGVPELTAIWTDPLQRVRCRARADYYVQKRALIVDVKTTKDASERSFMRDVFAYKYHWQHAIYRAAFAALGQPAKHFAFVAVEKTVPYAVAVYTLDEKAISIAHDRVRELIAKMATCLRNNEWPGYPAKIQTIQTPDWAA